MAGQQETGCLINDAFQAIQEYLAGQAADWMEKVGDQQYNDAGCGLGVNITQFDEAAGNWRSIKMRATVIDSVGDVLIETVPDASLIEPTDALIVSGITIGRRKTWISQIKKVLSAFIRVQLRPDHQVRRCPNDHMDKRRA